MNKLIHKNMWPAYVFLLGMLVFPAITSAAVTYHRTPTGASVPSTITASISFTDFESDFGVPSTFYQLIIEHNWQTANPGADVESACFPATQLSTALTPALPVGFEAIGVYVEGYEDGVCGSASGVTYYVEGDGKNKIFSIGGVISAQTTTNEEVVVVQKTTTAATHEDNRNALIAQLLGQIEILRAQLAALTGAASSNNVHTGFLRDLSIGMIDDGVKQLQKYLNTHGYEVARDGEGSQGNETNYFGILTQAALVKFQTAVHITPSAGYLGPKTRALINAQQNSSNN